MYEQADRDKKRGIFSGFVLTISLIILFTFSTYLILVYLKQYVLIGYVILSIFLFKSTFAIKSMEIHTIPIAEAIREGKINEAKILLSRISRRETRTLDSNKIISGAIEAIAEGSVDGIISPLFYFSILEVPGAIAYRIINTLDSMIGYKDKKHLWVGWFASRLDTITNYIPARLVAINIGILMILQRKKYSRFLETITHYRDKTSSVNAGWPLSAMAAILNVRLEKPGFYQIGYAREELSWNHIYKALTIMKQTTILSIILIIIPVMILMEILSV